MSLDRSGAWDNSERLVSVRELKPSDVAYVDQFLPLSRLTERTGEARKKSTYLVAWDGREPVGHAHIAWTGTHLAIPEIQDVFVLPERRRQGSRRSSRKRQRSKLGNGAGIASA
jgi:hypothetical protein